MNKTSCLFLYASFLYNFSYMTKGLHIKFLLNNISNEKKKVKIGENMVLTQEEREILSKENPSLVEELVNARNMGEINKDLARDVRRALERTDDERFKGIPVVNLSSRDTKYREKISEEKKAPSDIVRRYGRLRNFGAAIDLAASNAYNVDIAKKKAERVGYDSDKELSFVRKTTLDYSAVYSGNREITKTQTKEEKTPMNLDEYLAFKYSKFGPSKEELEEQKIKEREEKQLEREKEMEEEYGYYGRSR